MEKYFEISKNKQNIRCKLYYDKGRAIEKVVLFGHGFAGHKDNNSAQKFANRLLTKYKGIAVLVFNLPCHGDDIKKKLTLPDCMTYISLVVDYIKAELHTDEIYSYSTSFGSYLVLKYIYDYENPFRKIAMRSPAVNMCDAVKQNIMRGDELDRVLKGKNVSIGFDRKIEISRQFLTELEEADIRTNDYTGFADDMLMLHGTRDEVISFEASQRFAASNHIEFIAVENADHRFQNPEHMELATKKVIEHFGFGV